MSVGFLSDFCWIYVVFLLYAVVCLLDFCGMSFGLLLDFCGKSVGCLLDFCWIFCGLSVVFLSDFCGMSCGFM